VVDAANRSDWKNTPLPLRRAQLLIDLTFTSEEFTRLASGLVSTGAGDSWFIYFESPWLYMHESNSGCCIYQVKIEREADGCRVREALVNRDSSQHRGTNDKRDELLLGMLLLKQSGRDTGGFLDRIAARERATEIKKSFARGSLLPAQIACSLIAVALISAPFALLSSGLAGFFILEAFCALFWYAMLILAFVAILLFIHQLCKPKRS